MTEETNYRNELENQAKEIDRAANVLSQLAADMNNQATDLHNQANLIRLAAQYGFDYGDWESTIETAKTYNGTLQPIFRLENDYINLGPVNSTAGSAVVSGIYNLVSSSYSEMIPEEKRADYQYVTVVIDEYFESKGYRNRVKGLLDRLGFNNTTEGSTAIKKFEAAWEIYLQNPKNVDVALAALIPLRESIHLTANELLRRRPNQVKVKEKIIGIGHQLGFDSVFPEIFIQLETEFTPLVDELSEPKRFHVTRERVDELIKKGTLFLDRLLTAIDGSKLR